MQQIQLIEGDTHSQLIIPNEQAGNVLQLLTQQYYVEIVEMNDEGNQNEKKAPELIEAKNFLRRVPQFMITAFKSYLREKNWKCTKKILQKLEDLKVRKESIQKKYELGDLRQLVLEENCVQIFDNFLCSRELWVYIRDNKKIKQDETRLLYWTCISLIQEEMKNKKTKFLKFISDTNAKIIADALKYIRSIERLRDHRFFKEQPRDVGNHQHSCWAESNSSGNQLDQFSNPPFWKESYSGNSNEVSTQYSIFCD